MLKFLATLAELEFTCMRAPTNKKIYVVDYGIMVNPNFAGQDGMR